MNLGEGLGRGEGAEAGVGSAGQVTSPGCLQP